MRRDLRRRLADDADEAFPDFVRAFQDEVFSGVLRLVPARGDAEEVTQETFLRALTSLRRYPRGRIESMRLRPWVWTIAVNLCRNHARDRGRRPRTVPLTPEAGARSPAGPAQDDLAGLLDVLPPSRRAALVLRYVADLPLAEVAAALGRPLGTVKADIHRGLRTMRDHLAREEDHDD
ncbi:MAG TPA: sigma-70 family RNA polymerase sigma factor [Actinomycetota bacterium]